MASPFKQQGFTLIELMIAVSILGVLAALAIANFSRYESRARQGEAKLALSAIHALEASFYAEWGAYMEDFQAIGYVPEGFKRHYTTGWRVPTPVDAVTGFTGLSIGQEVPHYDYNNIPTAWGLDDGGSPVCDITGARGGLTNPVATSGANIQSYVVRARGVLRKGTACDVWQIDQLKTLQNTEINL